jgi:hypothetical protein
MSHSDPKQTHELHDLTSMPKSMKANESPNPKDVCLLGTETVMAISIRRRNSDLRD